MEELYCDECGEPVERVLCRCCQQLEPVDSVEFMEQDGNKRLRPEDKPVKDT